MPKNLPHAPKYRSLTPRNERTCARLDKFLLCDTIILSISGSVPLPPLMRPRRPAFQYSPVGVFPSNPFAFMQFRTLLRNGVPATPLPSSVSALFSIQWRGEGCPSNSVTSHSPLFAPSPLFATDPRNRHLSSLFATLATPSPGCGSLSLSHQLTITSHLGRPNGRNPRA